MGGDARPRRSVTASTVAVRGVPSLRNLPGARRDVPTHPRCTRAILLRVGGLLVRRARPSDLDQLLALYRALAGDKRSAVPSARAASLPILERALTDDGRHLVVAELDGRVCATADMVIVSQLTHHGMPWAIVENVVVADEYRRKGIATEIMRHRIDISRRAGCCKLELLSGKHRRGAHALYRSIGMQAVSEGFKLYFDEP